MIYLIKTLENIFENDLFIIKQLKFYIINLLNNLLNNS